MPERSKYVEFTYPKKGEIAEGKRGYMKKPTTKRLRVKAWGLFSEWVRRRDADSNGYNRCVACGKREHWKDLHAGHFYHGKNWMSAMDERNVFPECNKCNTYLGGNLIEYSEFLRKKFGPDIIDTLRELRHQGWKPNRLELEELIERYRQKLSELNA